MDRRLTAGELHDFRPALGTHKIIEHGFHFFQRQAEAGTSFREAKRASHVAGAVDLDDAETSMLLMVRTEAAIMRAPFFDFRSVRERDRARLVELAEGGIGFGVPIDQSFEGSTVGTPLGHEHFVIAEQDFGVDYFLAIGADAAGEFVKDVIGIFLSNTAHDWILDRNCGIAHRPYAPEAKETCLKNWCQKRLGHYGEDTKSSRSNDPNQVPDFPKFNASLSFR